MNKLLTCLFLVEKGDFVDGEQASVEYGPVSCLCGAVIVEEDEKVLKAFHTQAAAHCFYCPVFTERKAQAQQLELDQRP